MAISFGPKLNLLYNSLIGESYFDSLRLFLQSVDQLINGSVINATQVSPPTSPNPGDAYLLIGGTPGGAWTGQSGNIAFWDAQLTQSGTNNVTPGWVFLEPLAGWVVWNVALSNLYVFNGTSWSTIGGGANFPTNTDITSLTGIPNTTIDTTGYQYNDGTDPATVINSEGILYGDAFNPNTGAGVQITTQAWASEGYTGVGLGIQSSAGTTLIGAGVIGTSSTITAGSLISLGFVSAATGIRTGSTTSTATVTSDAGNVPLTLGPLSNSTSQTGVIIASGTGVSPITNKGLLGFAANYYTQTTVGAAGTASALPATPSLYLPVDVDGTIYVLPLYAHA